MSISRCFTLKLKSQVTGIGANFVSFRDNIDDPLEDLGTIAQQLEQVTEVFRAHRRGVLIIFAIYLSFPS